MVFKHGTNISHWLSQSLRRGAERRAFFRPEDVRRLADWGFDHLRLPVDEEQLWDDQGHPVSEAFDLLDAALDWCEAAGLRVIVDLHILRSHHFNSGTEPALFTRPEAAEAFAALWGQLSERLRSRACDRVAYELLNEPVAADPQAWNRVARTAWQLLRQREPERMLVLGSNRWNSPGTFEALEVPADPRLILTFHYYSPMRITHYQASWWRGGADYDGPLQYPGRPIPETALAACPPEVREKLERENQPCDRGTMEADLAQPLAVAARTGCPLYCGEFGVYQRAPWPVRAAWYRDFVGVLESHGIGWANWDYKGGFALVEGGRSTGVAEVLLGSGV